MFIISRFTLIVLFMLATCATFSQSEKDKILDIKQKYLSIEQWLGNESRLPNIEITKQCIDLEDENYEDVTPSVIQYYYNNEELRYIIHYYEPHVSGLITTKYYLWNDELFFCFQSGGFLERNFNRGNVTVALEVFEKRIYYSNDAPFQCLVKTYRTSRREEENLPLEDPYGHLNVMPNKAEDCEKVYEGIYDRTYYLELLTLSDVELKENCMSLKKFH